MNPLLVTFSPLIPTKIGHNNRNKLINSGFDNYFCSKYKSVKIPIKRFFFERGNPKIHWDAGVNCLPVHVAVEKNIKLIFFAEHGESEYGGKILKKDSDKTRDLDEVLENQVGDISENWVDDIVSNLDLNMYKYPDLNLIKEKKIKAYYFSYFFNGMFLKILNIVKKSSTLKQIRTEFRVRSRIMIAWMIILIIFIIICNILNLVLEDV